MGVNEKVNQNYSYSYTSKYTTSSAFGLGLCIVFWIRQAKHVADDEKDPQK
jgi:hypothetical protein